MLARLLKDWLRAFMSQNLNQDDLQEIGQENQLQRDQRHQKKLINE